MSQVKERPILFSAPMVRATLEGRKTVTRRAMKVQPVLNGKLWQVYGAGWSDGLTSVPAVPGHSLSTKCPYGQRGEHLWVRETFYAFGRWETRFSQKKGRDEWHFVDMTIEQFKAYQFEPPQNYQLGQRGDVTPAWWKRPAIFMPRGASRILLEITDVRVERLQDISDEQALAEGVHKEHHVWRDPEWPLPEIAYRSTEGGRFRYSSAKDAFEDLWGSINGPDAWNANPWVWCVNFRRIEQ